MAFILSDRVKETTSTTGTGTYTLGGASTGFESFGSIGNSNTTYYCCTDGTDFEVGIGTYTASGTTLARTTILQSSNSDNEVNWSAGTREIFCTLPAEKSVVIDNNNNISLISGSTISDAGNFALDIDGNVTFDANGGTFSFQDDGLDFLNIKQNAGNAIIKPNQSNKSIVFQRTNGDEVARVSNNLLFDIKPNRLAIDGTAVTATAAELNKLVGIGTIHHTGNPNNITDIGVQAFDVVLGVNSDLIFEGATNNDFETTLTVQDPTADRTVTIPNASGSVQLNRGNGEINGGFENFQQDYQSSSYFVAGEYIEIATINPTANSSNYNFVGTLMAQVSQNIQVLDIKVGIRYSSSGSISREIGYTSHQIGDDYVEPVLWINTSTNTIKLLIKGKTGSIHKLGVNLCFFQRGAYTDTTWNTTVIQDTTSVPSGYTEYTGEKVSSFITNGAVELYHNNVKKLETTSTGVTVTGLLSATTKSFDIEHPTKHNMRLKHGSLEGPEHGVYVRGILTDENVIELPDYWTGLVHEDSITAQLTPKGHMQQLYVKEIRDNKVYVENTSATKIDCFYFIQGNRKDTEGFDVEYES